MSDFEAEIGDDMPQNKTMKMRKNNSSPYTEEQQQFYDKIIPMLFTFEYYFIPILSMFGLSLAVFALWHWNRDRKFRHTSLGQWLFALSVADCIYLTSTLVVHSEKILTSYITLNFSFLCAMEEHLIYFSSMWSAWIVMFVSIERFIVVSRPFSASNITIFKTRMRIAIIAMIAFVSTSWTHYFVTGNVEDKDGHGQGGWCRTDKDLPLNLMRAAYYFDSIAAFVMPWAAVLLTGILTIVFVYRADRNQMMLQAGNQLSYNSDEGNTVNEQLLSRRGPSEPPTTMTASRSCKLLSTVSSGIRKVAQGTSSTKESNKQLKRLQSIPSGGSLLNRHGSQNAATTHMTNSAKIATYVCVLLAVDITLNSVYYFVNVLTLLHWTPSHPIWVVIKRVSHMLYVTHHVSNFLLYSYSRVTWCQFYCCQTAFGNLGLSTNMVINKHTKGDTKSTIERKLTGQSTVNQNTNVAPSDPVMRPMNVAQFRPISADSNCSTVIAQSTHSSLPTPPKNGISLLRHNAVWRMGVDSVQSLRKTETFDTGIKADETIELIELVATSVTGPPQNSQLILYNTGEGSLGDTQTTTPSSSLSSTNGVHSAFDYNKTSGHYGQDCDFVFTDV